MKKRAQLPNVRTYTIIFRGLAMHEHPKTAVAETLKLYQYLLKDTRLDPNSIHLNAALTVCAKAGDLDALFVIADSINEGTRAPTASTYTVILNALRHKALGEIKSPVEGSKGAETAALTEEQRDEHIAALLDKAKSLWSEVQSKWESGKLVIDESLVCAMGRLLLMSPKKEEKREIFDLLATTMNVPNLIKNPELGVAKDSSMKDVAKLEKPQPPQKGKASLYAVPKNNTLSLILTTLAYTREVTAGIKYWNLLVSHYGVVPDQDIWARMLKMLRAAKASAHASNMVEIMPKNIADEKAFRVAMETCVRDNLNPNAVKNSNKIFNNMLERLRVPDPHTMRQYLRTALVSHQTFRDVAKQDNGAKIEEGKRLYGEQILKALGALWEPYKQAYYHYWKATTIKNQEARVQNENNKAEVMALARAMVSAFDKLVNEQMLPESQIGEIKPVAAKIHREIRAHFANTDVTDPEIKKKSSKTTMEAIEEEELELPEKDDDYSAAELVGPEWAWDTYKPLDSKTRREKADEKSAARAARREARKEQMGHATVAGRGDGERHTYPWESGFTKDQPYDVMEARKKRPKWSPEAPRTRTGSKDRAFKVHSSETRKTRGHAYREPLEAAEEERRAHPESAEEPTVASQQPNFEDAFENRRSEQTRNGGRKPFSAKGGRAIHSKSLRKPTVTRTKSSF